MAPANWKELIDNGNQQNVIKAGANNATNTLIDSGMAQDQMRRQPQSPPSSSSAGWPAGSPVSLGGIDLLPVYCGLLGCLIIGLVAWILIKQMLRRASDGNEEKTLAVASGEDNASPQQQQQPLMHQLHLNSRDCQAAGWRRPKRRSADSGFGGSELAAEDDPQQQAADLSGIHGGRRLLRELSDSRLQRLENILANDPDPNGWRRLAHELGLTQEELLLLESHSACGGNQPAIRQMLRTWCQRPAASVASLARSLRRVGRTDALILFRESPFLSSNSKANQQRLQRRIQQRERKSESDEGMQQQQQLQNNELLIDPEPEIPYASNNNSNTDDALAEAPQLLRIDRQEDEQLLSNIPTDKPVDLSTSSAVLFTD